MHRFFRLHPVDLVVPWMIIVCIGMGFLVHYEATPGEERLAPDRWPADSGIGEVSNRTQLVMFLHPHCPCSRASVSELERIMARCQKEVTAKVVLIVPEGRDEQWARTNLWKNSEAIPGVTIELDHDGSTARTFGAETSGHVVLYSASGELLFKGGITASRGHEGDNAGHDAIVSLVKAQPLTSDFQSESRSETCVFGCQLFSESKRHSN